MGWWLMSDVVILDGAWGTQLQSRGLAAGECPDEWNLSHPDAVAAVAAAYADRVLLLADGRVAGMLYAPSADDVAKRLAHLGG